MPEVIRQFDTKPNRTILVGMGVETFLSLFQLPEGTRVLGIFIEPLPPQRILVHVEHPALQPVMPDCHPPMVHPEIIRDERAGKGGAFVKLELPEWALDPAWQEGVNDVDAWRRVTHSLESLVERNPNMTIKQLVELRARYSETGVIAQFPIVEPDDAAFECNRPAHQDGHHGPECYGIQVRRDREDLG